MRKLLLALCMCFCFIGCNMETQNLVEQPPLYFIASEFRFSDMDFEDRVTNENGEYDRNLAYNPNHNSYAYANNMYAEVDNMKDPSTNGPFTYKDRMTNKALEVMLVCKDTLSLSFYKNEELLITIGNCFDFSTTGYDISNRFHLYPLIFIFYDDRVEFQKSWKDKSFYTIKY